MPQDRRPITNDGTHRGTRKSKRPGKSTAEEIGKIRRPSGASTPMPMPRHGLCILTKNTRYRPWFSARSRSTTSGSFSPSELKEGLQLQNLGCRPTSDPRAELPPTATTTPLVDATTNKLDNEPRKYLTERFSQAFGALNSDSTIHLVDEAAGPEDSASSGGSMCAEKPRRALSRLALERAPKWIITRMATDPEDMLAHILKCLGAGSRKQLAGLLTDIIRGEPVPKDWR
ncbi:hypothetical protein HPB50_009308 [Hyalomma asiaticum]|uniref:Uncharacterized protein n=1 Tax=Hyalomma asiaticum TaxID=266040 RepID=A0ACB7TLA1_HYAAI|nr:hypothetical protein HPB50_009308 [Hyalomma asiaticum]